MNTESIQTMEDLYVIFQENLPKYWKTVEACLANIATLTLKENTNCNVLVVAGETGTGKTTCLDCVDGTEQTYASDEFTPQAFISNIANSDKNTLSKEVDKLPRIKHKCLIISDFNVMSGKHGNQFKANLSTLTKVLDGKGLSTDKGVYGKREYSGDYGFAMLIGTTPFRNDTWKIVGKFGERMLYWRMLKDNDDINLIEQFSTEISFLDKKETCVTAVHEFMKSFWHKTGGYRQVSFSNDKITREQLEIIVNLANFITKARATIEVWQDSTDEFQFKEPSFEHPQRAMNLLLNLAKGRALLYDRDSLTDKDMELLVNVAISSCPDDRARVIRKFIGLYLNNEQMELGTIDICNLSKCGEKRAGQIMSNLDIVQLVETDKQETDTVGRPPKLIKPSLLLKQYLLNEQMGKYLKSIATEIPR